MGDDTRPISGSAPAPAADRSAARIGERVGRYVLLHRLGQGGGGQVFAAFDTVLDRNVALKELWDRPGSADDVVREGRLLARLSHPAVVTIHDIAFSDDGRVFLAMELVAGESFLAWARARRDTIAGRREIMTALGDVAAGIVAAHEHDVIHGDVKPSNILVDEAGRARVTDFGVARIVDRSRRESVIDDPDAEASPIVVAGTPAYMAPEQHAGAPADERADQYSFCLTAIEALTGVYPFELGSAERDAAATFSGGQDATGPLTHPWERLEAQKRSWRGVSSSPGVPPRWSRVLQRGLESDPDARWASMAQLRASLVMPRERRWPLVVGGVAMAGVAGVGWAWALELGRRCTGADAALAPAWDPAVRDRLAAALQASELDFADGVWSRVSTDLDDFAARWVAVHTDACEATKIRDEQSETRMELQMACLRRGKQELVAVTQMLADPDDDVMRRAHKVVAGLPDLSRCQDGAALEIEGVLPDDPKAVAAVREQLMRSKFLRKAGRVPDARETVEAAAKAAASLDYDPLQADVLVEQAIVLEHAGDYEASKLTFEEAVKVATRVGAWDQALRAQRGLLYVVGSRMHRPKEAVTYLPVIQGLVERLGERAIDRGDLASDRAVIAYETANFEQALEDGREALAAYVEARGELSLPAIWTRRRLGATFRSMGRGEEAETELRAAIDVQRDWLGAEHPEVLETRCDLAQVLFRRGTYAEAERELEEALPPLEAVLGVEHPVLLGYRATLAEVLLAQDRRGEAEAAYRRALANMGDGPGPEAELRNGLGNLLEKQGRLDEAEAEHRRVAEVFTATLGADHPNVAISKHNLANVLARKGQYDDADEQNQAALSVLEETLGPAHPQVGALRLDLGRGFKNRGMKEEARAQLEAGIEILERALGPEHPDVIEGKEILQRLQASP